MPPPIPDRLTHDQRSAPSFNPDLVETKFWVKPGGGQRPQLFNRGNGQYDVLASAHKGTENKATLKLFDYSKERQVDAQLWIFNISGNFERYFRGELEHSKDSLVHEAIFEIGGGVGGRARIFDREGVLPGGGVLSIGIDAASVVALAKASFRANTHSVSADAGIEIGVTGPSVNIRLGTGQLKILGFLFVATADFGGGFGAKGSAVIGAELDIARMRAKGYAALGGYLGAGGQARLGYELEIHPDTMKELARINQAYEENFARLCAQKGLDPSVTYYLHDECLDSQLRDMAFLEACIDSVSDWLRRSPSEPNLDGVGYYGTEVTPDLVGDLVRQHAWHVPREERDRLADEAKQRVERRLLHRAERVDESKVRGLRSSSSLGAGSPTQSPLLARDFRWAVDEGHTRFMADGVRARFGAPFISLTQPQIPGAMRKVGAQSEAQSGPRTDYLNAPAHTLMHEHYRQLRRPSPFLEDRPISRPNFSSTPMTDSDTRRQVRLPHIDLSAPTTEHVYHFHDSVAESLIQEFQSKQRSLLEHVRLSLNIRAIDSQPSREQQDFLRVQNMRREFQDYFQSRNDMLAHGEFVKLAEADRIAGLLKFCAEKELNGGYGDIRFGCVGYGRDEFIHDVDAAHDQLKAHFLHQVKHGKLRFPDVMTALSYATDFREKREARASNICFGSVIRQLTPRIQRQIKYIMASNFLEVRDFSNANELFEEIASNSPLLTSVDENNLARIQGKAKLYREEARNAINHSTCAWFNTPRKGLAHFKKALDAYVEWAKEHRLLIDEQPVSKVDDVFHQQISTIRRAANGNLTVSNELSRSIDSANEKIRAINDASHYDSNVVISDAHLGAALVEQARHPDNPSLEAIAHLESVLLARHDSYDVHRLLAEMLFIKGQRDEDIGLLERAEGQYAELIGGSAAAESDAKNLSSVRRLIPKILFLKGKAERDVSLLQKAVARYDDGRQVVALDEASAMNIREARYLMALFEYERGAECNVDFALEQLVRYQEIGDESLEVAQLRSDLLLLKAIGKRAENGGIPPSDAEKALIRESIEINRYLAEKNYRSSKNLFDAANKCLLLQDFGAGEGLFYEYLKEALSDKPVRVSGDTRPKQEHDEPAARHSAGRTGEKSQSDEFVTSPISEGSVSEQVPVAPIGTQVPVVGEDDLQSGASGVGHKTHEAQPSIEEQRILDVFFSLAKLYSLGRLSDVKSYKNSVKMALDEKRDNALFFSLHTTLGELYLDREHGLRNYSKAERCFHQPQANAEAVLSAELWIAKMYMCQSKIIKATRLLKEIVEANPENPQAAEQLAEATDAFKRARNDLIARGCLSIVSGLLRHATSKGKNAGQFNRGEDPFWVSGAHIAQTSAGTVERLVSGYRMRQRFQGGRTHVCGRKMQGCHWGSFALSAGAQVLSELDRYGALERIEKRWRISIDRERLRRVYIPLMHDVSMVGSNVLSGIEIYRQQFAPYQSWRRAFRAQSHFDKANLAALPIPVAQIVARWTFGYYTTLHEKLKEGQQLPESAIHLAIEELSSFVANPITEIVVSIASTMLTNPVAFEYGEMIVAAIIDSLPVLSTGVIVVLCVLGTVVAAGAGIGVWTWYTFKSIARYMENAEQFSREGDYAAAVRKLKEALEYIASSLFKETLEKVGPRILADKFRQTFEVAIKFMIDALNLRILLEKGKYSVVILSCSNQIEVDTLEQKYREQYLSLRGEAILRNPTSTEDDLRKALIDFAAATPGDDRESETKRCQYQVQIHSRLGEAREACEKARKAREHLVSFKTERIARGADTRRIERFRLIKGALNDTHRKRIKAQEEVIFSKEKGERFYLYFRNRQGIIERRMIVVYRAIDSSKKREHEQSREGHADQGYIRHKVDADGDCGYTAFGITREQALRVLADKFVSVRDILQPAVKEALLTDAFYDYLRSKEAIPSYVSREDIRTNLHQYAVNLNVLNCYLNYDVKDKRIDAGWAHPAVLQALAHIQNLELRIWRLGENDALVPHRVHGHDYSAYTPSIVEGRVDLLFVNGNHFERLDFVGYNNGIPHELVYPLNASQERSFPANLDQEKFFSTNEGVILTEELHKKEAERVLESYESNLDKMIVSLDETIHKEQSKSQGVANDILEQIKSSMREVQTNAEQRLQAFEAFLVNVGIELQSNIQIVMGGFAENPMGQIDRIIGAITERYEAVKKIPGEILEQLADRGSELNNIEKMLLEPDFIRLHDHARSEYTALSVHIQQRVDRLAQLVSDFAHDAHLQKEAFAKLRDIRVDHAEASTPMARTLTHHGIFASERRDAGLRRRHAAAQPGKQLPAGAAAQIPQMV